MKTDCRERGVEMQGEQGFMLVGLIVAIFLILLALSVAAPKVAQDLRREREVEAVHRGNQYVRAIRLYYRKTHAYPGSIEQLEKTNNIRFLRQQYIDPMTGKADWRLIHVGEAKTTVKGFFGAPLAGLATGGLGSATPSAGIGAVTTGSGPGPAPTSAFGSSSSGSSGFGSSSSGSGFGSSSPGAGGTSLPTLGGGSSPGGATNGPATLGSDNSSNTQGQGAGNTLGSAAGIASSTSGNGGLPGGGAPFVGVGVPKEGDSITILNEQTTYNTWEFIYDPRIEQLYAKGALFGGGSTGTLGSGSSGGNNSGFGGTSSGFGSTPGSGFGTTPGSGSSGFGSSPGSNSPTTPTPTTPPQQPQ